MKNLVLCILLLTLFSCQSTEQTFRIDEEYLARFEENTMNGLAYNRPYYLQLVSFSKLDSKIPNRFGRSEENEHVLDVEGVPDTFGSIEVLGDSVLFTSTDGLEMKTEEDSVVKKMVLKFNEFGNTIDLFYERFSWRVVTYGTDKYLRVRDLENKVFKEFRGYKRFELTSDYIFKGMFEPYDPPKLVKVPSSMDFERKATFIGTVSFAFLGQQVKLEVQEGGHIMFSDETSALETYGSGRYLKYDEPAEDGSVIIDFNYAYNPPCIFSDYTTCMFPPAQNRSPFEIRAGEMVEGL